MNIEYIRKELTREDFLIKYGKGYRCPTSFGIDKNICWDGEKTDEECTECLRLAIESIKFKNERCDYCNNEKSLYYDRNGVVQEVYIEEDKTLSITHPISDFSVNIKINYCPICGEKLVKE